MGDTLRLPADWREQLHKVEHGAMDSRATAKTVALIESWISSSPLSDSETEWGWDPDSEFPGDVIVAVDEAAARERAGAARGRLLMQRRAPGPWIEVTS